MKYLEKAKHLLAVLLLCTIFSGCSTTNRFNVNSASSQVATAHSTRMLVIAYIGEDEIALKRVEAPLATLSYLLAEAEQIGNSKSLLEFLSNPSNEWFMSQSLQAYSQIAEAINDYHIRSDKPVPKSIRDYDRSVVAAYNEVVRSMNRKDRNAKISELVVMLTKMFYAKNGLLT